MAIKEIKIEQDSSYGQIYGLVDALLAVPKIKCLSYLESGYSQSDPLS
jgi:hypothetical protein